MPDLVNYLKQKVGKITFISKAVQEGQGETERLVDAQRENTFHLSGTPVKAAGKPLLNVFWTMADVIATP